MSKNVIVESVSNGTILVVKINRPEHRNAIDRDTADELHDIFVNFDEDNNQKVAILMGNGGNFCAGADLKAINNGNMHKIEGERGPLGPTRLFLSKPVIAVVSGYAVAGGLELACWCDMRICEESAIFGVFCRRFGVPLIDGGTVRLPRLIGHSRALDMILSGRSVEAKEAFEWGLANRLCRNGKGLEEALDLAELIKSFPESCMKNDRKSSYEQFSMNMADALQNEFMYGCKTLATEEYIAGSKRFSSGEGKHGKVTIIKSNL